MSRTGNTGLERGLRDLAASSPAGLAATRAVDTAAAWRDLRERRERSRAARRRGLAAACVAGAAAIAIAVPAIAIGLSGHRHPARPPGTGTPGARTYPRAIVARIPMSGVVALAADAGHAWIVRQLGEPHFSSGNQLAGINLRTNSVMFRASLGKLVPAIAAGDGRLWLTTASGQARGQIDRVDLATGQVISAIHLHAGLCTALSYSSGSLYAACEVDRTEFAFWRINPRTQRAVRIGGPVRGYVPTIAAAPDALFFVVYGSRIEAIENTAARPQPIRVRDPGLDSLVFGVQGNLVYGDGSIWALGTAERLARIDPSRAMITQFYTYRDYDPHQVGGLNVVTAGGGWLWFLDDGYPFSGVLRVSEATGRPAGGVPIPPDSCGQQACSQIYYTPGAIWVPTAELLLRIDPSRLPR